MTRNGLLKFALSATVSAGVLFPGNLPIGVANAVGSFSVNNAVVQGTADVSDGAELETASTPSEIRLQNGADVRLSSKSAGALYADHAVLERGALRVQNFDKYPVTVRQLQIEADSPQSEAVVRLKEKTIEVASLGGSVRVGDGASMLTHVAAGTRMSFQNQNGAQSGAVSGKPTDTGVASDTHVLLWFIAATAGAAVTLGIIAGVKGKNPF